mmetsp:Transcript_49695/g.82761  ORF Transcript_49695/g.82761 Transcript_49695/m.82761 type:complete len:238 (-) Transcript_49695:1054-1767(-)
MLKPISLYNTVSKYPLNPCTIVCCCGAQRTVNDIFAYRALCVLFSIICLLRVGCSNDQHCLISLSKQCRIKCTTYGVSNSVGIVLSLENIALLLTGHRNDRYLHGIQMPSSRSTRCAPSKHSGLSSLSPNEPSNSDTITCAFCGYCQVRISCCTICTRPFHSCLFLCLKMGIANGFFSNAYNVMLTPVVLLAFKAAVTNGPRPAPNTITVNGACSDVPPSCSSCLCVTDCLSKSMSA